MLSFTGNLILWILCILFRLFVLYLIFCGISNIYKHIKAKIEDKIIDRDWRKAQKEKAEEERLSQMTADQIKEEKQINGEIKFVLLIIGIIIILGVIIFLIKNFG